MRKLVILPILCSLVLVLSGCWDQRFFKEVKLALASGYDVTENGKLLTTATLPNISKSSQGPGLETVQIVTVKADTPRQSRVKIDREISKTFDSSKMRVLLFSQKLAKQGIYPLLDVFYRDPSSAINMNLGVVQGRAKDALTLNVVGESQPSEYLSGILNSASRSTLTGKGETIEGIAGKMLAPGSDAVLPYMIVDKKKRVVKVDGLALFNGDNYSGIHLNSFQSTLFTLMNNQRGAIARLTVKVAKKAENSFAKFLTMEVKSQKIKKKMTIGKDGKITAQLHLNLKVRVIEYAKDKLNDPKNIERLNKRLSNKLTKQSVMIVRKLQKADCDALGFGNRMRAFHRSTWKKLKWEKTYPTIKIQPKVTVEILQHGIIE